MLLQYLLPIYCPLLLLFLAFMVEIIFFCSTCFVMFYFISGCKNIAQECRATEKKTERWYRRGNSIHKARGWNFSRGIISISRCLHFELFCLWLL